MVERGGDLQQEGDASVADVRSQCLEQAFICVQRVGKAVSRRGLDDRLVHHNAFLVMRVCNLKLEAPALH